MNDILQKLAYIITEKAEALAKGDKWTIGGTLINPRNEAAKISHLSQIIAHEVRTPGQGVIQLEGYFQSIYLDEHEEVVARKFFAEDFNIEQLRNNKDSA